MPTLVVSAAMTIAHPGEVAKSLTLVEREESDSRRLKNILDACPGAQRSE
jgi:hypothetical protein